MNVLKNVLNDVDTIPWYVELGCTGKDRCLKLCDVFIGRGTTWWCICVVYYFLCRSVFQFLGNTQFCANFQQDQVFCLHDACKNVRTNV